MFPTPLPAPFGGMDIDTPVIALRSPYCENLYNFNVVQEGVALRNGDSKYSTITQPAGGSKPKILRTYGQGTRGLVVTHDVTAGNDNIYDIDTGANVATIVAGNDFYYTVYFKEYLYFLSSGPTGYYYDGSAFGAMPLTYNGTALYGKGGNVYKERAYYIQGDGTLAGYLYTNIGQVTGAIPLGNRVDLGSILQQKAELTIIASFTLSDQVTSVLVQAFIFSNGEVLFYTGSYPNSADWTLAGRAKIGQPFFYNNAVSYQGDSLIICDNGVVSLRDLFLKGSEEAANLTVNTNIQRLWRDIIVAARTAYSWADGPLTPNIILTNELGGINGVWDSQNTRLIFKFPFYLDSNGALQKSGFFFIFDTELKAWSTHRSFGVTGSMIDMAIYKNKVLMLANGSASLRTMIYQKEGSTAFTDRAATDAADTAYDYEIKSAPFSTDRAYVQLFKGMDVIVNSDLHGQTNYQFIRDFGVQTTTAQKVNAVSGSLQKPFVNAGIEGSYIQYKISGTTTTGKTVGYQLYGTNMWSEQGASPR